MRAEGPKRPNRKLESMRFKRDNMRAEGPKRPNRKLESMRFKRNK